MDTTTYTIQSVDTETTPAWMGIAERVTPASQDSGRVRYTATVDASRADEMDAALGADADVFVVPDHLTTTPHTGGLDKPPQHDRGMKWVADQNDFEWAMRTVGEIFYPPDDYGHEGTEYAWEAQKLFETPSLTRIEQDAIKTVLCADTHHGGIFEQAAIDIAKALTRIAKNAG